MTTNPTKPFDIRDLSEATLAVADRRAAVHAQGLADHAVRRERLDRARAADALWEARGVRYRCCTLENFQAVTKEQRQVLAAIRRYAENIPAWIDQGVNILLNGRPGTGKDHLLAGLMHVALDRGRTVGWVSGTSLFRQIRDEMDDPGATEYGLWWQYVRPDVLVISDPARKDRVLTDHQQDKLYDLFDARYNDRRPTWVTLNASDGKTLNSMIGCDNVDRLRDGGLSLPCNWNSHRKAMLAAP